jgi:hypothetical protein
MHGLGCICWVVACEPSIFQYRIIEMQIEMYAEMTEEEIDTAIDVIYARIDSLLDDAQFWEVNDILEYYVGSQARAWMASS